MQISDMNKPEQKKLTDWPNEPDVKDLKADFTASKPAHDTQVSKVNEWLNLRDLTGDSKVKPIKGRSTVQPQLVRRHAEWRYSALSEPFLSSDRLFNVFPVTFEDGDAAKQNELVLNWQFRTKLNLVKFIDEYIRTTVDEGTCVLRIGWKRETEMEKIQVPIYEFVQLSDPQQMQMQAQALQEAAQLQDTNPRGYDELSDDVKAAVEYFMETGIPVYARVTGTEEQEQEKVLVNEPTLQIVNYNNVFIDPSCEGDIDKAQFVATSFETSKAELEKDGRYKNLDSINWDSSTILASPDHDTTTPDSFNFKDEPRKRIVAYEYWGWYDIEDTGKPKPIVATWVGDVMIRMEENPYPDQKLPFIVVNYMPVKRSLYGEPDAELLRENQKILGAVTRGTIDLLARSANSQTAVAKGMLDVTNKRRFENGQDYEYNPGTLPQQGIYMHTFPEIPNSAITVMQLQNQEAETLTGVKAFSGGISGDAYGDTATGIRGVLDASSKREMAILRRLAKGIKDIGAKLIGMNYAFMSDQEVIRVTNKQFVQINREDLKGQFDLEVDISTAEIDNQKSQDLSFMLQTIGNNMDIEMNKLILSEIASLKRMPDLAEKIARFQPQPDPIAEQIKQLEVQKLQMEIQELQTRAEWNQARARQASSDADLKNLDYVEQDTGTKHARDMQKQAGQAEGNQDLEVTKALLNKDKEGIPTQNIESAVGFNYLTQQTNNPN